ncbi:MAG: hypothetical protein H0Z35_06655 [Thermoanaerobacteraceae bacterium]|nr:hypothetical protein [Thermoanaerobacteraceae bacterium]
MTKKKKPISKAKLEANRRNAKKSTGPRTAEGKQRSAQNALKSTGPKTAKGKARSAFNATKSGYWTKPSILRQCLKCDKECNYSWPPEECIRSVAKEIADSKQKEVK